MERRGRLGRQPRRSSDGRGGTRGGALSAPSALAGRRQGPAAGWGGDPSRAGGGPSEYLSGQRSSAASGKSVAWHAQLEQQEDPWAGLSAGDGSMYPGSTFSAMSAGFPVSTGVAASIAAAYQASVKDTLKESIPALIAGCKAAAQARFMADPRRSGDDMGEFRVDSALQRDITRIIDKARSGEFAPIGAQSATAAEARASLPVLAQVGDLLYRLVEAMVASSREMSQRSQAVLLNYRTWTRQLNRNANNGLPCVWTWEQGLATLRQTFRVAESQVATEAKLMPKPRDGAGGSSSDIAQLVRGLTQAIKGGRGNNDKPPKEGGEGGDGSRKRQPKSAFAHVPNPEQQDAVDAVLPSDAKERANYLRTRVCWQWVDESVCRFGDNCTFSHAWSRAALLQAGATDQELEQARGPARAGEKRKAGR